MDSSDAVLLDLELDDPATEADFLGWWDEARRLLAERSHLLEARLVAFDRGRYLAELSFPMPGIWDLVERDHRWRELLAKRPAAREQVREGRYLRREGSPTDLTTAELVRLLEERDAGRLDLVLVDARGAEAYAEAHLPGAVHLPASRLDAARAEARLGRDRSRPVVTYCSDYG